MAQAVPRVFAMRDSDKAQARAGHLPIQVLVGVKKYYSIKWRGNPGLWKLGPFCCQMILPTFFVWLAMVGWPTDQLRLKEHRQTWRFFGEGGWAWGEDGGLQACQTHERSTVSILFVHLYTRLYK